MRKAFLILYEADGRRRFDSDVERSFGQEWLAFQMMKKTGMPPGVVRAEYHDTDAGGNFPVLLAPAPSAPSDDPKPKKKAHKTTDTP